MDFAFVSGRACLDLLGTLKWRRSTPEEQLATPADFARWAVAAGLVDEPVRVSPQTLAEAIVLRETVYELVHQRLANDALDHVAVATLNRFGRRTGVVPELANDGTTRRRGTSSKLFATLAADAVDLLGGPLSARVRECDDPKCTRLFLDHSRGRPRRWCGMNECGNRAKVNAYRARRPAAR